MYELCLSYSPPSQLTISIFKRPGTTCPLWPYLKPFHGEGGVGACPSFLLFVCLRGVSASSSVGLRSPLAWAALKGFMTGISFSESRISAVESISRERERCERRRWRALGVARGLLFKADVGSLLAMATLRIWPKVPGGGCGSADPVKRYRRRPVSSRSRTPLPRGCSRRDVCSSALLRGAARGEVVAWG